MATREEQTKEAVRRLQALRVLDPIIDAFRQGIVAESKGPLGECRGITDPALLNRIHAFEEKYHALVYHVIHVEFGGGILKHYLFVSAKEEEWQKDWDALKDGEQIVYVDNYATPKFSEFGTVGVKRTIAGGLERDW